MVDTLRDAGGLRSRPLGEILPQDPETGHPHCSRWLRTGRSPTISPRASATTPRSRRGRRRNPLADWSRFGSIAGTKDWPGFSAGLCRLDLGESIAVNGCCLTVVSSEGSTFDVQAGPETLAPDQPRFEESRRSRQPGAVAPGRRPPGRPLRPGARRHHGLAGRASPRRGLGFPPLRPRPDLDAVDGPQRVDRRRRREPDARRRHRPTASR